jgi:type II secretory pathway component PulF
MSDETSTEPTALMGPGTRWQKKPHRKTCAFFLLGSLVVTVVGVVAGPRFQAIPESLGGKGLPLLTDAVMWISQQLQRPAWMAIAVCSILCMALLVLKGLLDRFIKLLIGLNILWLIIFLLATLTTWVAIFKVGEKGTGN